MTHVHSVAELVGGLGGPWPTRDSVEKLPPGQQPSLPWLRSTLIDWSTHLTPSEMRVARLNRDSYGLGLRLWRATIGPALWLRRTMATGRPSALRSPLFLPRGHDAALQQPACRSSHFSHLGCWPFFSSHIDASRKRKPTATRHLIYLNLSLLNIAPKPVPRFPPCSAHLLFLCCC
jgi:hypothetical protein